MLREVPRTMVRRGKCLPAFRLFRTCIRSLQVKPPIALTSDRTRLGPLPHAEAVGSEARLCSQNLL